MHLVINLVGHCTMLTINAVSYNIFRVRPLTDRSRAKRVLLVCLALQTFPRIAEAESLWQQSIPITCLAIHLTFANKSSSLICYCTTVDIIFFCKTIGVDRKDLAILLLIKSTYILTFIHSSPKVYVIHH